MELVLKNKLIDAPIELILKTLKERRNNLSTPIKTVLKNTEEQISNGRKNDCV